MKVQILGANVDAVTMKDALTFAEETINKAKLDRAMQKSIATKHIITLNAEIIYRAQGEPELLKLINQADLVTPDGAGVVWAAKHLGTPVPQRVTGIDLLQEMAKEANEKEWKLFFFGGAPGIAEEAKTKLEEKHKNIKIVGTRNGYISTQEEETNIIEEIISAQPDILAVALGAPKQEYWIKKHKERIQVPVAIGVGGSFDVLAGKANRAPVWMQKAQLEWFYRLVKEPWRYKRMLSLPKFMGRVMMSKKK